MKIIKEELMKELVIFYKSIENGYGHSGEKHLRKYLNKHRGFNPLCLTKVEKLFIKNLLNLRITKMKYKETSLKVTKFLLHILEH